MPYPLLSSSPRQSPGEGLVGFGLGAPDAFKRLRELGLSRLGVKLQGLVLFGESLELLLHLAYSGFLFLPFNAFFGRLVFGLGQRFCDAQIIRL